MLTPAEEFAAAKSRICGYNDALVRISRMFGEKHQTAVGIKNCIAEVAKELAHWQGVVDRGHTERILTPPGCGWSDSHEEPRNLPAEQGYSGVRSGRVDIPYHTSGEHRLE